VINFLMLH